jgi:hypothetical protein
MVNSPESRSIEAESGTDARRARMILLTAGVVGALTAGVLLTIGPEGSVPAGVRAILMIERLVSGGVPALVYVVAAIGLGRVWTALVPHSGEGRPDLAVRAALGLATLFFVSHLLGWVGVLTPPIALGVLGVGAALALHELIVTLRAGVRLAKARLGLIAMAPAASVLALAACCTPGWLWSSEFGGYDALSYHLQLPREWIENGQLSTLRHNVYSALPSSVEAAFMHVGAAMQLIAPQDQTPLVGGDGHGLFACQMLHALLTVLAAWCVGGAARRVAERAGLDASAAGWASTVSAGLVIATPWAVVVGSLAYNETPMLIFAAAAIIVALNTDISAARRGTLAGMLVGAACCVKPTALLMLAPGVALLLAMHVPMRQWWRLGLTGCAAGLVMLGPWLTRNAIETGNPVFPFASRLFANQEGGTGHWTREQADRFARGHAFDGSFTSRVRLIALPEPRGSQPSDLARYRGVTNPQWGGFFYLLPVALVLGVLRPGAQHVRRAMAGLAGLVGLAMLAWLFATHVQSRFLLPLLAPGAIAIGIWTSALPQARLRAGVGVIVIAVQSAATVLIFVRERDGNPLAGLDFSPAERTGEAWQDQLSTLDGDARRELLTRVPTEAFANLTLPEGTRLGLVGDATPLYFLPRAGSVEYNTTWDAWPIATQLAPSGPVRTGSAQVLLVNLSEVARLSRSGWADPMITTDRVRAWIETRTRLLWAWPESGVYLVKLAGVNTDGENAATGEGR